MLNIKTIDNNDRNYKCDALKVCYKSDIDVIYGDSANFQFDILRH
jgi:hypothetical protein